MGDDSLEVIARQHGVSTDAAGQVERALRASGGLQAQFDHPDLGGRGQWMPGMVMVGRTGDEKLRGRVAALCEELASLVRSRPREAHAASDAAARWWPAALGEPASSGGQHGVRYAYFPARRRLLVETGGRAEAYDTGEHRITGVSQSQSSPPHPSRLIFVSQLGEVSLEHLTRVSD